jgi:predicted Ser/Thr protein kinase
MMTCPQCGTAVPAGATSCTRCGSPVTDPVAKTLAIATEDVAERDALLAQLRHELADEYEVERELGRGGMGVVFKAVEIELGRPVALKVLPPGLGQGAAAERFRREARLAAALDHPSIIPIYRVGRVAGTYYFAMKLIEGRALDEIIEAQGALPLQVILAVLRSTTSALAFAHDRGIVHRDIKGGNILIDRDGRVMISDFGIARAGQEKTLTAQGAMMGTPYYMSPEQGWGGTVGPQSDQYALGILTFQMVTGQVPFDADSLMTILQHHYFTPPPDVRSVRDGLPAGLVRVLERALKKNAAERFPFTREMLAAVEAVPSSEEERGEAREMLRQLAGGGTVAKVRTGSLPPLDSKHFANLAVTAGLAGAPAHLAAPPMPAPPPRAPAWWSRTPLRRGAIGLGALVAIAGLWWLGHPRAHPAQPQVAAAPSAPAPSRTGPAHPTTAARRPVARHTASAPAPSIPYTPPQLPAAAPGGFGKLRLYTIPQDASIAVDGEPAGTGILSDFMVAAGRRRIRVSAPGYATRDTTVTVTANRMADVGLITLKRSSP